MKRPRAEIYSCRGTLLTAGIRRGVGGELWSDTC